MMGIGTSDARRLTLWEYSAMRHVWNERHKTDEERDAVEAPSVEFVRQRQRELAELGISGTKH